MRHKDDKKMKMNMIKNKISQKGLWAALLVLTLTAFILLNVLSNLAGRRFDLVLDLTEERLYALSQQTREVLENLPEETTLYIFSGENEYPLMLRETLRRVALLADNLQITYADPLENPLLMTHYQQMGHTLNPYDILVEGAKRIRVIPYQNLILYENGLVSGIDLEQQLASALIYVNSLSAPRAVFTAGHQERPSNALKKLFSDNNFTVETKAVLSGEMMQPEIIIMAAPAIDFSSEQVAVLKESLAQGSKLMVFLEPGEAGLPNLDAFLKEYGLTARRSVLFEQRAFAAGLPQYIIPMYAAHPINEYFKDNPIYVVAPSSGALQLDDDSPVKAQALLTTTDDAYAKSNANYTLTKKEDGDETGRFTVAALSDDKVFLMGSRMVYSDDLMSASTYANRMFLTRVVGFIWQEETAVNIPPKSLSGAPLPLAGKQAEMIGLVLSAVFPLTVLAAGAFVTLRRRKKL